MKLYIFNPDTDIAISSSSPHYMPPANVVRMKRDLDMLPLWYGNGGVLRTERVMTGEFAGLVGLLHPDMSVVSAGEVFDYGGVGEVCAWGWNSAVIRELTALGVPQTVLPDAAFVSGYRDMASRRTSIEILSRLRKCPLTCGERFFVSSVEGIDSRCISRQGGLAKELWSSSGTGLCRFTLPLAPDRKGRINRWIRKNGGVTCEPFYDKAEDFAMEFYRDISGKVRFCGYSLFKTDSHGAYDYNMVMSDEAIVEYLSRYVPCEVLRDIACEAEKVLSDVLQCGYVGYLGIDMMICRSEDNGSWLIHPCVEMNLRMNMGVLSGMLYRRFMREGSKGRFGIVRFPERGHLRIWFDELCKTAPVKIRDGRIESGAVSLTPVTDDAMFGAFLLVK